jgi:hypothetical protein
MLSTEAGDAHEGGDAGHRRLCFTKLRKALSSTVIKGITESPEHFSKSRAICESDNSCFDGNHDYITIADV